MEPVFFLVNFVWLKVSKDPVFSTLVRQFPAGQVCPGHHCNPEHPILDFDVRKRVAGLREVFGTAMVCRFSQVRSGYYVFFVAVVIFCSFVVAFLVFSSFK